MLAIVQSVMHIHDDVDRVRVPVVKPDPKAEDRRTHPLEPLGTQLKKALLLVPYASLSKSGLTAVAGPIIYTILLRDIAWGWTLYFARLFWDFPKSASHPTGMFPAIGIGLIVRSVISGALLVALWEISNLLFSTFLGQAPLKRNVPLTNGTKDPNGSLINGVQSNKEVVKTYALWELSLIGQQFPDRRKEIFNDIDREGGAAWSQILSATTEAIKGITNRINEFNAPPAASEPPKQPSTDTKESGEKTDEKPTFEPLPRLSAPPKQENIFLASPKPSTRPERFEAVFGTVAKSYGQAPDWTPKAKAKARDFFDRASTAVLSPSQREKLSLSAQDLKLLTGGAASTASGRETTPPHPILGQLIRSPLGYLFRQPYKRRLRRIVLGSPHSSLACIVDATDVLTRFLVASLTEDQLGKVQADVAGVIKLLTETISALEAFVSEDGLPVHWTDVDFPTAEADAETRKVARKVDDVEIVIARLKLGLSELLAAFKPYLSEVGVTKKDLRLAKEAAGDVNGTADGWSY